MLNGILGMFALVSSLSGVLFFLYEIWLVSKHFKNGTQMSDKNLVIRTWYGIRKARFAIWQFTKDVIALFILGWLMDTMTLVPSIKGPVAGAATVIVSVYLIVKRNQQAKNMAADLDYELRNKDILSGKKQKPDEDRARAA